MLQATGHVEAYNSVSIRPQVTALLEKALFENGQDVAKGALKPFASFDHTASFVKDHRFQANQDINTCASCHAQSFCSDCHGGKVPMKPALRLSGRPDREAPHRGDFMTLHRIEGKLDPTSCFKCHGRANNEKCQACHR